MAQTFWEYHLPDPRLDPDGKPSRLLSAQYKSYKIEDPPPKQQKALPGSVLVQLHKNKTTECARVIADLCTGAFFFAMQPCKYLSVTGNQRKTKHLCIRNFRFFKDQQIVPTTSTKMMTATVLLNTFEDQKNDQKFDTITMHSAPHKLLCPVKAWARVISRILLIQRSFARHSH